MAEATRSGGGWRGRGRRGRGWGAGAEEDLRAFNLEGIGAGAGGAGGEMGYPARAMGYSGAAGGWWGGGRRAAASDRAGRRRRAATRSFPRVAGDWLCREARRIGSLVASAPHGEARDGLSGAPLAPTAWIA